MTIEEEKAKAYDKALERARKLYEQGTITESLGYVFPELKESEDEKIRKELIDIVAKSPITFAFEDKNKVLAWLEKQGEQKPVVIIPKFRIGDNIKTTNEEPLTITKIDDKGYWSEEDKE